MQERLPSPSGVLLFKVALSGKQLSQKREKKKESFFNLQLNPCNCRVLFSFYTSKVFFFTFFYF